MEAPAAEPAPAFDNDFFRRVAELVAHPIFVKDRSCRLVFLNDAFVQMVGFSREQMLGKTDYDLFPREEADFFREKDEQMFRERRRIVIEEEPITDSSGVVHVLTTTKVPMFDHTGEPTHLVGIIHDISQLKQAETALLRSNLELEARVQERTAALRAAQADLVRKERLAVLGSLAGGVAHQIRNPLGAIKNATHLLEGYISSTYVDRSGARHALSIIHEEIGLANRIITDLLDYARVRPPECRPIDAGFLVEQVLGAHVDGSSVAVLRELAAAAEVLVDPEMAQGALANVIRNAVEAAMAGGRLPAIVVSTRIEGVKLVIRIRDNGPGVSAEIRPHLFEPLYTSKPTGLGLGLVTARALLEVQGARLELAESGPDGAAFEVTLPCAPAALRARCT